MQLKTTGLSATRLSATRLYLVRHCAAVGQAPEAPLTPEGLAQADQLATFLRHIGVDRVVSSPFLRARQSIEPLARLFDVDVRIDPRLAERVLAAATIADWRERLRQSFDDPDLCLDGGESGRTAAARGVAAVDDALQDGGCVAVVTHGNLMALVLRHVDSRFGFDGWHGLTTPDVFRVSAHNGAFRAERIWSDG